MTDPTQPQQPPVEPQPPVQYVYVQAPPARPTDPWSIVSLIFGILSVAGGWCCFGFPGFIAIITGLVGYKATDGEVKSGRGLAIAGMVMGWLTAIPWFILGISGVVGGIGSSFQK